MEHKEMRKDWAEMSDVICAKSKVLGEEAPWRDEQNKVVEHDPNMGQSFHA